MNQSPPSTTYDCRPPSITRSTPSPPIPACRSHRNRTSSASRSPCTVPSGSGSSTKSFSVPCPFSHSNVLTDTDPTGRTSADREDHLRVAATAAHRFGRRQQGAAGQELDPGRGADLGGGGARRAGRDQDVAVGLEHRVVRRDEVL